VIPKSMDSLDAVEIVMVFEEIFETDLPVNGAESLGGPTEVMDWLELHLSNQRPNTPTSRRSLYCSTEETRPCSAEPRIGSGSGGDMATRTDRCDHPRNPQVVSSGS
jgi:hypothetical protein